MSAKLLEDARAEARKASEAERLAAENEVQSLVARREFLVGDVDQLEQFLIEQRERLRTAARQLEAMCDRVPAGLGHVRPPVLSASDDPPGDDTAEHFRPPGAETLGLDDDEPAAGDDVAHTAVDDETAAVLEATARRRRPVDEQRLSRGVTAQTCASRRAVPGIVVRNGVDEAITSEPPEERRSDPLSRTGRVQPVIAGEVEWPVPVGAGNQGGTAGRRPVPGSRRRSSIVESSQEPTSERRTEQPLSDRRAAARPAGDRARGARPLGARRHVPPLGRATPRPASTATTSSCSTTARRSPTGSRTTATC